MSPLQSVGMKQTRRDGGLFDSTEKYFRNLVSVTGGWKTATSLFLACFGRNDQAAGNAPARAADGLGHVIVGLFVDDEVRTIRIQQVMRTARQRNAGGESLHLADAIRPDEDIGNVNRLRSRRIQQAVLAIGLADMPLADLNPVEASQEAWLLRCSPFLPGSRLDPDMHQHTLCRLDHRGRADRRAVFDYTEKTHTR